MEQEDKLRAALQAAKDDPMACHSIAVWEQINEALLACGKPSEFPLCAARLRDVRC
jgi:hypothetical protein